MTTDLLTRPDARLWTPENLEILDDVTRREFLAGLAAAGLLAGCGTGGPAGPDTGAAAGTRRIDTPLGPVEVPAVARRVAAMNYFGPIAFDLGAPLVTRSQFPLSWKQDDPRYTGLPVADTADEVALPEQLLLARPDVILALTFQVDGVRDEVARIAPIVEVPDEFGNDWRAMWRMTAQACGLDPVDQRLSDIETRAAQLGAVGSAAILRPRPDGQFRVYRPNSFCGELLDLAGFDLLRLDPDEPTGVFATLAAENLDEIQAARIFVWTTDANAKDGADLSTNPLWARLPAVEAGQVHVVGEHWIGYDVESVDLILADVARAV